MFTWLVDANRIRCATGGTLAPPPDFVYLFYVCSYRLTSMHSSLMLLSRAKLSEM